MFWVDMRENSKRRAFTLVEVVVVITIIALLAALLFPVLRSARAAAKKAVCANQFRQATYALNMYLGDYDERFPLVNYAPSMILNPSRDRTWVQLLLPYMVHFEIFRCPADTGRREPSDATFDDDLVPGDTYSRYYRASLRSNIGYNYLYYSPVIWEGNQWVSKPRTLSQIAEPARALVFMDSAYARDSRGTPFGGGSYVVIPPCRWMRQGWTTVDSFGLPQFAQVFTFNRGWDTSDPFSDFRYGLAWPWHEGRLTVSRVGGSTTTYTVSDLTRGCDAREDWMGLIRDDALYPWDFN